MHFGGEDEGEQTVEEGGGEHIGEDDVGEHTEEEDGQEHVRENVEKYALI